MHRRLLALALTGALAAAGAAVAAPKKAPHGHGGDDGPDTPAVRLDTPQDRYAMAGGCYVARSLESGHYLTRSGNGFAATGTKAQAEPLHFQAFDLGKYLLFASKSDFVATDPGPVGTGLRPVVDTANGYVKGTSDERLKPARDVVLPVTTPARGALDPVAHATRGSAVLSAATPSGAAEWLVRQAGGAFVFQAPVDDGEPENPGPVNPSIEGTMTAAKTGALTVADGAQTGPATRFALTRADGCATWPEVEVDVTGAPATGPTPYGTTQGYIDAHLHAMAFEFLGGRARCGRPWHPYGVAYALVDCPDHGPGGYGALLEQALSGNPHGHDTVGWPTFGYWPRYDSLTHEQVYYRWLERAWRGGLRMYTNLLVENGVLCELYPLKKNSCNEMDAVRLQAVRLHELERYIDAQNGGPGKGWFRLVTDPFQARRVVNAGKLAVIMGIEVSVPFDCGEILGVAQCTQAQISQRLDEVYAMGVRQMELTNKFDNALTGVTGDDGTTGVIVNNGNKYETGHYWKMGTCADPKNDRADKLQPNIADAVPASPPGPARDAIFGAVLQLTGTSGAAPLYPPGPHCNAIGLSDLGRWAIKGLADRGMVFDPDHMSAAAREASVDYVANVLHYSGIVSSHSWADDPTYRAILHAGGVVTPHAGGSTSFVAQWRKLKSWSDPRFTYGIGYGSDVNGFSVQGGPRNPAPGKGVRYPFTGLGGVVVDKQVSGQRTYDINTDGVDHYGLYPDWVEDARLVAGADGAEFVADLARGVEAYLQMWERAVGVAPDACRPDVTDLTSRDLHAVKRHMTPEDVLQAVGQPHTRDGNVFRYCTEDGTATVVFDDEGRVGHVSG